MSKSAELPNMPKIDKSAELAISILETKDEIKDLRETLDDLNNQLSENLIAQNRSSIRVTYEKETYTLEVQHIDEQEKIKIKKG